MSGVPRKNKFRQRLSLYFFDNTRYFMYYTSALKIDILLKVAYVVFVVNTISISMIQKPM